MLGYLLYLDLCISERSQAVKYACVVSVLVMYIRCFLYVSRCAARECVFALVLILFSLAPIVVHVPSLG